MARPKTYIIKLSDKERATLQKTIHNKKTCKTVIRYNISPNSSAALRKVDGRAEARIIQMACSPAPKGHSRWTLRLLEEKARIELDVPVGREAIRQTLKK